LIEGFRNSGIEEFASLKSLSSIDLLPSLPRWEGFEGGGIKLIVFPQLALYEEPYREFKKRIGSAVYLQSLNS
jgi:hypothetical protein